MASGKNRAYFANGTVGGKPARIYTVYVGKNDQQPRRRDSVRASDRRHRPHPEPAQADPAARGRRRNRRRRRRRRARLPRGARAGPAPHRRSGANRPHRRSERARGGRRRTRRARPARHGVQHDARRARGIDRHAAALRRRRLARAANAADEPADEHRGPEAAGAAAAGPAQQAVRRPRTRGARDARSDHRPPGARARRRNPRAEPGAIRRARRERGRARAQPVPEREVQRRARTDDDLRLVRTARARGLEPARERRQVERTGREPSTSRSSTASCACGTTARVSRRTTRRTSSTASIAPRQRDRCPAPASASRSCAKSRRRTVAASRRRTPPAAARCSGCGWPTLRSGSSPLGFMEWPHPGPPWRVARARCSLSPGACAGPSAV